MKVINHWLDGAIRLPYPASRAMEIRRFGVAHFTAGATALSSIDFWRTKQAKGAEAHVCIDRDGTIYQILPFDQRANHAGESSWVDPNTGKHYSFLNQCSIGVEFANAGDAARADGTAFTRFKLPAGVIKAKHRNGGPLTHWEAFPEVQILAGIEVFKAIVTRYNLDDLVGHEDIAPKRKNDPGPAFPMLRIREACGFKGLPKLP